MKKIAFTLIAVGLSLMIISMTAAAFSGKVWYSVPFKYVGEGEVTVVSPKTDNTVTPNEDNTVTPNEENTVTPNGEMITYKSSEYLPLVIDADVGDVNIVVGSELSASYDNYYFKSDTSGGEFKISSTGVSLGGLRLDNDDVEVNIIIPADYNNSIEIDADVGNIEISDLIAFTDVNIDANVGNVELSYITANTLNVKTDVGNAELEDIVVAGNLDVQTNLGASSIDDVTAHTIDVSANMGTIEFTADYLHNYDVTTNSRTSFKAENGEQSISLKTDVGVIEVGK